MTNCLYKDRSSHTLASMLGSTATTSDRHFMALVLTAMALSPRTRKIYLEGEKSLQTKSVSPDMVFCEQFTNYFIWLLHFIKLFKSYLC